VDGSTHTTKTWLAQRRSFFFRHDYLFCPHPQQHTIRFHKRLFFPPIFIWLGIDRVVYGTNNTRTAHEKRNAKTKSKKNNRNLNRYRPTHEAIERRDETFCSCTSSIKCMSRRVRDKQTVYDESTHSSNQKKVGRRRRRRRRPHYYHQRYFFWTNVLIAHHLILHNNKSKYKMATYHFNVKWQGQSINVELDESATVSDLHTSLSNQTGLNQMKLVGLGK
jgi:hypothetical protein